MNQNKDKLYFISMIITYIFFLYEVFKLDQLQKAGLRPKLFTLEQNFIAGTVFIELSVFLFFIILFGIIGTLFIINKVITKKKPIIADILSYIIIITLTIIGIYQMYIQKLYLSIPILFYFLNMVYITHQFYIQLYRDDPTNHFIKNFFFEKTELIVLLLILLIMLMIVASTTDRKIIELIIYLWTTTVILYFTAKLTGLYDKILNFRKTISTNQQQ